MRRVRRGRKLEGKELLTQFSWPFTGREREEVKVEGGEDYVEAE